MIAARNMPKRWEYSNKAGAIQGFPQRPVCSFCGEQAVFRAMTQTQWWLTKTEWYACMVCKEQLKEVAVKSFMNPPGPTYRGGVDELWYKMSKERVYQHPTYLKWQGC